MDATSSDAQELWTQELLLNVYGEVDEIPGI